jgi:DNA-binding response OmpR family regulator
MKSPSLLVVDDDPAILELLRFNLTKAGYRLLTAATGREATLILETSHPDLVVLDLMLPDLSGFDICRRLRERSKAPVIILSARYQESDRVRALEVGADDYMTKPFSPRELLARVKAHLRRWGWQSPPAPGGARLEVGQLAVDPEGRAAWFKNEPLRLTPMEFDILRVLCTTPGRVYPREQLLALATGQEIAGPARTVDVHIRSLRLKIEEDPAKPRFLETVWGSGYCLGRGLVETGT